MRPILRVTLTAALAALAIGGATGSAWASCKLYICVSGTDVPQTEYNEAHHVVELTTSAFNNSDKNWHFNAIIPGRSQFEVEANIINIPEYPGEDLVFSVEACTDHNGPFARSVCTGWSQFHHKVPGG